ncbi:MAG: DUF1223 domain-containing protein [Pseudomonadota bacterium]
MRTLLQTAAILMAPTLAAVPAVAETGPVVVELYTSQGCSSCPPADAMLSELVETEGVIPLALHVDYWDYIGWADEFANPAHTRRQQNYARAAGATTIYTPQFVVGGKDTVVGAKAMTLADQIRAHSMVEMPVSVSMGREENQIAISASWEAEDSSAEPMVVQLVRVASEETVDIKRGENAGHSLSYSNIVQSWDVVAEWDGAAPLSLNAEVAEADMYVVIVQAGTNGPILGAAKLY